MPPHQALAAIQAVSDHCQIIAPDRQSLHIATAYIQKHRLNGNRIFDAYFAATALSSKDFMHFEGASLTDPFV